MFRDKPPETIKTINCLITDAGLGDLLCSLMAVNHILTYAPWINPLIWVPDYMKDFAKHVLPSKAVIRNFTEAKTKYDSTREGISTKWNSQHTPMRTNPVKYAYHVLCDMEPNLEQMTYLKIDSSKINLSKFQLPEKYVVIQGAYTEKVKTMPVDTFNKLANYVISKGYMPVFLGKEVNKTGVEGVVGKASIDEGYDLTNGINYINQTTLLETAGIISGAKLVLAMDGGLVHTAGFTDTPIVSGYTFASPEQLMPIRDNIQGKNVFPVIPDDSLGCRFCQSNWTLMNHDFRNCFYDDFMCTKQMSFDKFKKQIEDNNLL